MTGPRWWRALALLVSVVMVVACGATPMPSATPRVATLTPAATRGPTSPAATDAAPAEVTAWQQVLTQVEPDGTVTAATALQAFALAFGPLPGVTLPAGPVGEIRSGSGALRWLVGHWDEISAEQRAAAVRLAPVLAGLVGEAAAPRVVRQAARAPAATAQPATYYAVLAQTMADEIEAQTHLHLDLTIHAAAGQMQEATSAAETVVLNAQGGRTGTPAQCVIAVGQQALDQPLTSLEAIMGHEVWHCYQGQIRGMDWYYSAATPTWLIEGQAEWVGDALRPDRGDGWWEDYIDTPGKPLFTRSYDALGFYADLTQAGINTWDVLIPMLQADDNNAARFEVAGATADPFLDTWASGYFREPAVGAAWEFEGPGLPDDAGPVRPVLAIANGQTAPFKAAAYANSIYSLAASADIIAFSVTGHVRLGDPMLAQDYVLAGGSFCTKAGGCTCPPGTDFAGAPPNPLSAESLLAVTGGPAGAQGTVSGHALEEFCQGSDIWSMVFWSPELGAQSPPLLVAYTCDGLVSTWKAVYLPTDPSHSNLTDTFELPFADNLVVHHDLHWVIPASGTSAETLVDYSLDFRLDPTSDPPVFIVTGTKTETQGGVSLVLPPHEFGSDAPLELKNYSLETQLQPYPQYQHPFRAQALAECGS